MFKEDALYMTGRVGKVQIEWLLDSGCSLSLTSVDVYRRIPAALRPELEENEVKMRTAYESLLPDYGRVHLRVKVERKEFMHFFIVAKFPNKGILGTDFLRLHSGSIDFS